MDQEQFNKYQQFTEKTIYDLSQKVTELEHKLNVVTNILEVSRYINQYLWDPNLFLLINDMLVGVFGVKYSTIYIMKDGSLDAVNQNEALSFLAEEKILISEHNMEEFIMNSDTPVYKAMKEEERVYCVLGVPIKVDNRLLGFIVVQHKEKDYFTHYHSMFLSLIGNHIGVAIENHMLQKQIAGN